MSSTKKDNTKENTNQFKENTDKYLDNRDNNLRIQLLMYQTLQKKLMKM